MSSGILNNIAPHQGQGYGVLGQQVIGPFPSTPSLGQLQQQVVKTPPSPFEQALSQVGWPRTNVYHSKANGDVIMAIKENIGETVKWHKAFVKVFEFIEAQLNIDLFNDDPEAKAIYISWAGRGLMALRDEAGGGVIK